MSGKVVDRRADAGVDDQLEQTQSRDAAVGECGEGTAGSEEGVH